MEVELSGADDFLLFLGMDWPQIKKWIWFNNLSFKPLLWPEVFTNC